MREGPADLLRGALDLLWPRVCFACGASLGGTREAWLCGACRGALPLFRPGDDLCGTCGAPRGPAADPASCRDCAAVRPRFEAVRAAGAWKGPLRSLVVALKYGRRPDCAWPLGEILAGRLAGWEPLAAGALLVPFPTTAAARRARGFDPPALLAREVARRLRLPLARGVLARRGNPPPQASLPRSSRLASPRGTVEVRRPGPVAGRTVLLVDDVLTTGASASEAARVLLRAGALRVLVAAAARA